MLGNQLKNHHYAQKHHKFELDPYFQI